jgi:hypothetical protein
LAQSSVKRDSPALQTICAFQKQPAALRYAKNPAHAGCIDDALTVWILPCGFAQGWLCCAPQNDSFLL